LPRPAHLPDFDEPPLIEVAMSVQFTTPPNYRHIYAGEVRALFDDCFSEVQEQPYIPPVFEVFGGPIHAPNFQINFSTSAMLPVRYWFTHPGKAEIIQFQPDRFIHNWRKMDDRAPQYPRFDQIAASYIKDLERLDALYKSKGWGSIQPNQCELTYVNHMLLVDGAGKPLSKTFYLKNVDMALGDEIAEFGIKAQAIMKNAEGKPAGRLFIDAMTTADAGGRPLVVLTLVARGAPAQATISSAFDFLSSARDTIVTTFAQITTDAAHQLWKRTK
jgi:uncharacterized protein (TIGR04255 family)